ncbi:YrhB domain-containing protein [Actinocrispum wychmicini]|uniref:Immunity protein 35 of polymorphic toxin system n=1 Tax=Actinocrispum wychmicini TaxID=1213861 RepID=A0A4R2J6U7_9PSEU|nr:YrhB domain-containing protein [Actinocrispum wychmicini]TCO54781.1 immunity protein 35 of polymorphic toxin system [Actinocrispum wychmicini]
MEFAPAREIALTTLARIDSPDEPLALFPDDEIVDVGWAWVFGYTTARWLATGDPDAVPPPGGGPIVVVKDTAEAWMLLGSRSYDGQLKQYAEQHGHVHTVRYG